MTNQHDVPVGEGEQAARERGPMDDSHTHDHAAEGHVHPTGLRGLLGSILSPHSHAPGEQLDPALASSQRGIQALQLSLVGLAATAGLQLVVVLVSGSVALLADTIHNFSDALTALPLWVAFVLGRRAATRRYRYGYGRAEDLAGLFIVAMIAASAALAAFESIRRLLDPQPVHNVGWVIVAALIGFAGNELVALYRIRVGRDIGSAALVADGYHARTDGLTSLAVLIGAAGVMLGVQILDPLVGLGITAVILFVLRDATRQMWHRLMDAADPELATRLEHEAGHVDGVEEVGELRVRWLGHRLQADLRVVVDEELSTRDSHAIGEAVRHALLHAEPKLETIVVHVDPCGHGGHDAHAATAHHAPAVRSN